MCGPDFQFYELISRWPGSTHENQIFNISETRQRLDSLRLSATGCDGVLVASRRFVGRSYVKTPVETPQCLADERYNESHAHTYVTMSRAIEMWKGRFRRLQTVLNQREGTNTPSLRGVCDQLRVCILFLDCIQSIIAASAVLHNIAIQYNQPFVQQVNKGTTSFGDTFHPLSNEIGVTEEPEMVAERARFIQCHFGH